MTATVELLNSSPAGVGQLLTLAGAASSRTVTIGVGQSSSPSSPSSVTNGGVAFDPLLAGNIQVRATIPGFALVPESTQTVTVSAP